MYRATLLILVLAVLFAGPAFATDAFPAAIQTKYGLRDLPRELCATCHTNGITGSGTVNTPFGRALRARGLMANSNATLNAALDALASEAIDSDGDGVTDIDELIAGTSPNVANTMTTDGGAGGGPGGGAGGGGGGVVLPPPAKFGCGASVVPHLLLLTAFVPLLRSRRRKR